MFSVINKNFNFSFINLSFSHLSTRKNFENFVHSSTAFAFDELNQNVEKNDESVSRKNIIKRKIILKMFRQKIVAHKTKSKINFRKRNKKFKTNSIDKVKRRKFKSKN